MAREARHGPCVLRCEEASVASSYNLRSLPAGAYGLAGALGLLVALAFAGSQELLTPARWVRLLLVLPVGALSGALAVTVYLAVLASSHAAVDGLRRKRRRASLERALATTEEALSGAVRDDEERAVQSRLGLLHLLLGNGTAAVRHLKRTEQEDEGEAALFNNVGVALLLQNRLDRAGQALYAAARRAPREPAVRLNLCLLERRLGRPHQALKHLRQAGVEARDRRWQHLQAELETRDGRPGVASAMLRDLLDGSTRDAVGTTRSVWRWPPMASMPARRVLPPRAGEALRPGCGPCQPGVDRVSPRPTPARSAATSPRRAAVAR